MNDNWIKEIANAPKIKERSQTGEEGYLKFILDNIGHGNKFLVDIGAWDGYNLSNTRYFMDNFGYESLLIDGDNRGNTQVKEEWITKENVCSILAKYNCPKEFSLMSYDTDGNDYDIIKEICWEYSPAVIICEINGTIPKGISKKIKYNPDHVWSGKDDYYGFSFSAAFKLAEEIGYRVVFQNDALNAYLVRRNFFVDPDINIEIPFKHNQYHAHNDKGLWVQV